MRLAAALAWLAFIWIASTVVRFFARGRFSDWPLLSPGD